MAETDASDVGIDRRRFLWTIGVASSATVAGCAGTDGDDAGNESGAGASSDADAGNGSDAAATGDADDGDTDDDSGTGEDSGDDGGETGTNESRDATVDVVEETPVDSAVSIAIEGLSPEETVDVATRTTDPVTGETWSARATFEATADGRVELDDQAPAEGDYEDVDGMGLFWAMTTDAPAPRAAFGWEGYDVDLSVTATDADEPIADATTSRVYPDVPSDAFEDDVVGTVHLPPGSGQAPAVLLLHGSGGEPLNRHAQLLADRGFVAGAIQYFGAPEPIPDGLAEIPVEYVETAIGQLLDHDRVAGEAVGVYGMSKGAELGLLAASHLDRIGAVASVSGSGVAWQGMTAEFQPVDASCWTVDGDPVPYVEYGQPENPETSRVLYEQGIAAADDETVAAATIPLDRTDAPVLAVTGGSDDLWHAEPLTERALDRLDGSHEYDHLTYEDAGHRIDPPYRPTYGTSLVDGLTMGGMPAANAAAAADHWPRVVEFFEEHLGE